MREPAGYGAVDASWSNGDGRAGLQGWMPLERVDPSIQSMGPWDPCPMDGVQPWGALAAVGGAAVGGFLESIWAAGSGALEATWAADVASGVCSARCGTLASGGAAVHAAGTVRW